MTPPPFQIPIDFQTNAMNATIRPDISATWRVTGSIRASNRRRCSSGILSVQRDIGWNTSVQVSYVGNHGVGLFRAIDVNQLNFNATAVCANVFDACPTDTFLQDFQHARHNGFASLAADGGFRPASGCPGPSQPGTDVVFRIFNHLVWRRHLVPPSINNYIQQGQIGQLDCALSRELICGSYYDTGCCYPGTGQSDQLVPEPVHHGRRPVEEHFVLELQRGDRGSAAAVQPGTRTSRRTTRSAR